MFRVSSLVRAAQRKGFVSGLAMALALGSGAAFTAPAWAQSDNPQYSKSFSRAAQKASEDLNLARNRPEVAAEVNNLIAASGRLRAANGDAAVAAAQAEIQAIGTRIQGMVRSEKQQLESLLADAKNGDEKYLAGDFMAFLGNFSNDAELRAKGTKLKLDSGVLKPEAVAPAWVELGQFYMDLKRFEEAHAAFDAGYKAGHMDSAIFAADAYYQANRIVEGLDYLEGLIHARVVAGLDVPQTWYGNGLTSARALGDLRRVAQWAGLYGARGNSGQSWNASIALMLDAAKFGLQEQLDVYRLMKRADALVTEGSYTGYLAAAMGPAGVAYPGEVVNVAQAARASGKVSQNAEFVTRALETAQDLMEDDRASLPELAADARKATNGADALIAGDAYLSYGMAAEAEDMFNLALSQGGVDSEVALTRLGIAQADQGKYAEARANFAKISGARAPIAELWLAWLNVKAPAG